MSVAADSQTARDKSVMAGKHGSGRDDSLFKKNETLCWLECRAGRICRLNRTVEERLVRVGHHFIVIYTAFTADEQTWIVGWSGDEAEYFAG